MKRVPGVTITPYIEPIQSYDSEFYKQFMVIIAGLDNIEARRWINQMVHSLVEFEGDEVKTALPETQRPLIDGGTEGFKG
jgi:ubiquitin-activating enzyme E1 C